MRWGARTLFSLEVITEMQYLVTGGAGFIGSHLVDALVARGDSIVVLDDLSTGSPANLHGVGDSGQLEFVEGSILDEPLVQDVMQSVDACVHLASAVGVQLVVSRPLDSLLRNVRGNDIVISTAARYRRPLLFTSTSEVYGKNSEGPLSEEADRVLGPPQRLRWSYATAKAFGEALACSYAREEDAHMSVVRLFNTVGPRQTGAYGMVLPRFVRQALAGDDLTVYGDGRQSRCFGHVYDVVWGILSVLDHSQATGRVFNIGSSVETSILDLAKKVIERAGSASRVKFVPYDEAYGEGFEELGRRRPDTAELEALTDWRPTRTVDEAIDDVIGYERATAGVHPDPRVDGELGGPRRGVQLAR
jgi:UDP-glucose 4-epimerase